MSEIITNQEISSLTTRNFVEYAKEVAIRRALPDALDGLKPVTRRVLYSMSELGLASTFNVDEDTNELIINEKPYKKSARIVGDTMGKYHPHGDSSIYGALVTATQDFRNSCSPISGYGNFGSLDDGPAAMRYCVVGDTLINTNNGLISIENIVKNSDLNSDNEIDIYIQSFENKVNSSSMFFNSGYHDTIEVVLQNGLTIKGSHNHPILTCKKDAFGNVFFNWKTLEEISYKDKIVINKKYNVFSNEDKINEKEAKFFAYFFSELTRNYRIIDIPKRINDFSIDLKLEEKYIKEYISKFNLENFDLNSKIPNVILESSLFIQKVFLKYLFACLDKDIDFKSKSFNFEFNQYSFVKTIQVMLLQFGVNSYVFKNDKKQTYTLSLFKTKDIALFKKNIGFYDDFHIETIVDMFLENYKENIENEKYLFLDIKEINECDKEIVYSIRVDSDCHSFVGNGFINHNTEARLSPYGTMLLDGLHKKAIPFQNNFDDTEKEPTRLPALIPNLLINGSEGIAVGMTTSIPPHNFNEVCDAFIYRINNQQCDLKDILKILKGPDFPTFGQIDPIGLKECYEKGNGKFSIRGTLEIEELPKGQMAIIVNTIPYGVKPESLIEKIADVFCNPKYEDCKYLDVENLSSIEGVCIKITFDENAPLDKIIDVLYTKTNLQTSFSYNFCAIVNEKPVCLSLIDYFDLLVEDKTNIVQKFVEFDLEKAKRDLLILNAKLLVNANATEIIDIIKTSKDKQVAINSLAKRFEISIECAQYITEMSLYTLTKKETSKLKEQKKKVEKDIKRFETILKSKSNIQNELVRILNSYKTLFSEKRKTKIKTFSNNDIKTAVNDYILQIQKNKYVKLENDTKTKNKLVKNKNSIFLETKPSNNILSFMEDGNFVKLVGNFSREEETSNIISLINMPNGSDVNHTNLFYVLNNGQVQNTTFEPYITTKEEKLTKYLKLSNNLDKVLCVLPFNKKEKYDVVLETKNGMIIRFSTEEVRETGINTGGMKGISLTEDDIVVNAYLIKSNTKGTIESQKRGGKGKKIK